MAKYITLWMGNIQTRQIKSQSVSVGVGIGVDIVITYYHWGAMRMPAYR